MAWDDNENKKENKMENKNIFGDMLENENDLDELFLENMPEYISDEMINDITPWRHATNMIIAGMAMSVVAFNILMLQYILPFAGTIMCLLGFRALRKDNVFFKACYAISVFQLCARIPLLAVDATIYASQFNSSDAANMLAVATAVLRLVVLLLMRQGFITVRQRAGQGSSGGAMNALVVWYIIFMGLAYVNVSSWIVFIVMIGAYIMIIRSLLRMARMIDTAGYAVHASEVKVSDRNVVIAAVTAVCVCIACGYLFFGGYAMDWQPVDNSNEYAADDTAAEQLQSTNAAEHVGEPGSREEVRYYSARKELLALGFPENVLDDMTYDDVMACAGAQRVVVWGHDYDMNGDGSTRTGIYGTEKEASTNMTMTDIGVDVGGGRWKFIDHFEWTEKPQLGENGSFYGTEGIKLSPVCDNDDRWLPETDEETGDIRLTGRVLYDSDGVTYAASYHYLGRKAYDSIDFFSGAEQRSEVFAEFSLPFRGENRRGYVMYSVYDRASESYELDDSGGGTSLTEPGEYYDAEKLNEMFGYRSFVSLINYTHQVYWLRYPVKTAADEMMDGWLSSSNAFRTVQSSFNYYCDVPDAFDGDERDDDVRYSCRAVSDLRE